MSFLNPLLLAGALAVAVPVVIHLLNRQRFRRVEWAAMRFLRAALEKNRRRLRLEDALLLALRCLMIALLAFALARPALNSARTGLFGDAPATAVILLDASLSLQAADGVGTRFDLARQAAGQALDALPAGSAAAVWLAGDRAVELVPEPVRDLNRVRQALREAAPTDLGTDHAATVARALETLRRAGGGRREILLVTDRQAAGWRDLAGLRAQVRAAGPDTALRVLFVGEPPAPNAAVTGLDLAGGLAPVDQPLRVAAEVRNLGATPLRSLRVTLHVDDGPAVDEAVVDTLAAGEARRLALFTRLTDERPHALTARISPDRLPADDARTLAVRAVRRVRVLAVGAGAKDPLFFLENALAPVPPEAREAFFIEVVRTPPEQFGALRPADFDAVVLANVPQLTPSGAEALAAFVRGGGGLLVFPGPDVRDGFYNDDLGAARGLLPARLGPLRGDATNDAVNLPLAPGPYAHPLAALWNDPAAGALTAARFRAVRGLEPQAPTNAPPPVVVLRHADGLPALIQGRAGRGRVLLASSTADTAWNDLPVRPSFLPLAQRLLAELIAGRLDAVNVPAGTPVRVTLPGAAAGRDATVTTPDGRRLTRPARADGDRAMVEVDATARAGAYRVETEGVPAELFAVQPDPAESDLAELSGGPRRDLEGFARVTDWTAGQDLASLLAAERGGRELWLPLALAALLVALAETVLAQRFSRQ
jgi:hypothetical protein